MCGDNAVQIDGVPLVVVIIGAGFCGMGVLKNLQQHPGLFRIIIIDQRDYFEFSPFVISRLGESNPREPVQECASVVVGISPRPSHTQIHPHRYTWYREA